MERKEKRRRRSAVAALMVLMLVLTGAEALAEDCLATVKIPAEYIMQGETLAMFTLKAEAEGTPMPEGSSGTVKTITASKSGELDFGEIRFVEPDVYRYTISRSGGDTILAYEATVMVLNDGRVSMVFKELNTGDKADRVLFADQVKPESPNTFDGGRLPQYLAMLLGAAGLLGLAAALKRKTGEERES